MAKMNRTLKVVDVSKWEGPLYQVMGEDEMLFVFNSSVTVLAADDKVYRHNTFNVPGHGVDEDGHTRPNYDYKNEVQAFIDRVQARGFIDLRFWTEVRTETFEEREAYNLRCEADERAWGTHA